MASTAVTQCFYSSSGGSPSGLALPTWLHWRSKNQEHCFSGPVQMTARVYPVQTPSFLTVWRNLGIAHSQVICSRLNVSGNLTRPSPTSPHCLLSAHPKSLLEFRKVETKACFDTCWNTLFLSAESSSLRVVLKRGGSESNYCPFSPLNNKTAFLDNLVKVQ